jgi:splicing factor 3B subunit 3
MSLPSRSLLQDVVDGDLCESFAALPAAKQKAMALELGRNGATEVMKKLEDIRNKIL